MIEINFSDPGQISYYYPVILILGIILLFFNFITYFLKKHTEDMNLSMNNTLQANMSYSMTFIKNKNSLKARYLLGYVLTRAAMWTKAPYLYTLYSTIHGFSMSEIGVLYIIDAVAALIAGPITGSLADKYGRKLFSQLYNLLVIINLLMRMTGDKTTAYFAQVLTGIGGGLINTVFESWVVYEANKEFLGRDIEKERFLKKLFKTQNILDAVMSIILSAICAIAYVNIFNLEFLWPLCTTMDIYWFLNAWHDYHSSTLGRK
jgi:MFS family permease